MQYHDHDLGTEREKWIQILLLQFQHYNVFKRHHCICFRIFNWSSCLLIVSLNLCDLSNASGQSIYIILEVSCCSCPASFFKKKSDNKQAALLIQERKLERKATATEALLWPFLCFRPVGCLPASLRKQLPASPLIAGYSMRRKFSEIVILDDIQLWCDERFLMTIAMIKVIEAVVTLFCETVGRSVSLWRASAT